MDGSASTARPRVVLVTTVPETALTFFVEQTRHMAAAGFDVAVISSPGPELDEFAAKTGITVYRLPMTRELTPWRDLIACFALTRLLAKIKPDIVHTHTPKAGFLGMLAAWLNRVAIRVYTMNGLPWMTRTGWRRMFMQYAERVACIASTEIISVSESVKSEATKEGIANHRKMRVLGRGASHGVDPDRFDPQRFNAATRREIRQNYGLHPDAVVVAFIGRFVRDKGIRELLEAWKSISTGSTKLNLLLVGHGDKHDPLPGGLWQSVAADPAVRIVREKPENMPRAYAAADICVLPTYREGLPNAALEAGAMALPMIATRVCGCPDAILHMKTGILIEPRNSAALAEAISHLATKPNLRAQLGSTARDFVSLEFSESVISTRLVAEYNRLLAKHNPAVKSRLKRIVDISLAAIGLIFAAPLIAFTAVAARLSMGSPAIFRQQRIGLDNRPFTLYKIRTMSSATDENGSLLPDEARLTRTGNVIRRLSLDELPQLWNVLRGDMSLVGPRPLLPEYLPHYNTRQRRRHEVKPGITGWAQINGRNAQTWEQRFDHDIWYIDHWSPILDLKILLSTVRRVIKSDGVAQDGHVTMPKFTGTTKIETNA